MQVQRLVSALSPDRLRERGLLGFSGMMAAICGAMAAAIPFFIVAVVAMIVWSSFGNVPDGRSEAHWGKPDPTPIAKVGTDVSFSTATAVVSGYQVVNTCSGAEGAKRCTITTRALRRDEIKPDPLRDVLLFAGYTIFFVPLIVLAFGLAEASACFVNLAQKRFFERRTVRQLRNFALCGLVFMVLFPNGAHLLSLLSHLIDAALNALAPRGVAVHHEPPMVSLRTTGIFTGFPNLLLVVYALTLTVIAAVMAKAATLAEDHAQIV